MDDEFKESVLRRLGELEMKVEELEFKLFPERRPQPPPKPCVTPGCNKHAPKDGLYCGGCRKRRKDFTNTWGRK